MLLRSPARLLLPGLLVLSVSCLDVPTEPPVGAAPDHAVLAKGGTGKGGKGGPTQPPADLAPLGQMLFGDEALSVSGNQSCQTCHEPSQGFAAPAPGVATRGSVVAGSAGGFGDRKPPTAAYATLVPTFSGGGKSSGGLFWDGRATGHVLGTPAADQALGPFLNPLEQGLPDAACVVWRVFQGPYYASHWVPEWGDAIGGIRWPDDVDAVCSTWTDAPGEHVRLDESDRRTVEEAYHRVALSIAAFEGTLNRFSSRFDRGVLDDLELLGEKVFSSKGKCQQCHENRGSEPLFTDHRFHNLGVPANPDNPTYDYRVGEFDAGLGGFTGRPADLGRFRTPTVRNVAAGDGRTYMHNGVLRSLEQVVQFYNTRDVLQPCSPEVPPEAWGPAPDFEGDCWPAPEYARNLDTQNMGNLGLTRDEVAAVVAYLRAMTDAELDGR